MRRRRIVWCLWGLSLAGASSAFGPGQSLGLELANDFILSSDNQFTNGTTLQHNSALFDRLTQTEGTLAVGQPFAGWFLPVRDDLRYRETWAIGQDIQTPADISNNDLILNDVPYTGILAVTSSFYGLSTDDFYGVQWLLGWVGAESLAQESQKLVHTVIGGSNPDGWSNQLSSEPLLNVYYGRKRKVYQTDWFDLSLSGDLALGNVFTYAQTGAEMRFGHAPDGFTFIPDPIGRGMGTDPYLRLTAPSYFYASMVVRVSYIPWALPRYGNLFRRHDNWTENNRIKPELYVGQLIYGLHYLTAHWAAHLTLWLSTNTIDKRNLSPSEDPRNSFGSFMMEYRF